MALPAIIQPLRPAAPGWQRLPDPPRRISFGYDCEAWLHEHGLIVFSAVEVANEKDGIDRGPEYHLSMSKRVPGAPQPARCSSAEATWILSEFQLAGAEEDNHVPHGLVRNFWRAVAQPLVGLECACKADEPAIVEDQGDYVWRP